MTARLDDAPDAAWLIDHGQAGDGTQANQRGRGERHSLRSTTSTTTTTTTTSTTTFGTSPETVEHRGSQMESANTAEADTTPLLDDDGDGASSDTAPLLARCDAEGSVDSDAVGVGKRRDVLSVLKVIAIGQFISLLLCSTGVFAKLLVLRGVNLPTTTSLVNYVLLAVVYVPVLLHRGVFFSALRSHWLFFVLVALVDVEANFVIIKAYQYTSFTSVQLLDCTAIVWVLLLSRVVLKTQHTWLHYLGVVVALVGTAGIIASDAIQAEQESGDQSAGSNPVLGDVLVLVAAVLYACSNVGEEYAVRVLTKTHFLGLVGLFGTLICGVQAAALELDDLKKVEWTTDVVFLLVGFVISLFAMYSLVPLLIAWSSAMVFNLSMLSADVYSFIVGVILFQTQFYWLYFVAFPVVLAGLSIYLLGPEVKRPVLSLAVGGGKSATS